MKQRAFVVFFAKSSSAIEIFSWRAQTSANEKIWLAISHPNFLILEPTQKLIASVPDYQKQVYAEERAMFSRQPS